MENCVWNTGLILSWNTYTLNLLQTFHGVLTRPFDSFCQHGFFGFRLCLLYQVTCTGRNPFRSEIKGSAFWMPLLSDCNQPTNMQPLTNKQQTLLWYYNSTKLLYLWGNTITGLWVTLSLMKCVVGLGLLSLTALSSMMTILPLVSQSSLRLEFPGSCFSCCPPHNISISSFRVGIHHYSMILGQQGVHGAWYCAVKDTCRQCGAEPPHWSLVLRTAALCGDSFLWEQGELPGLWGPGGGWTISVRRAGQQVVLVREGSPPTCPTASPGLPLEQRSVGGER